MAKAPSENQHFLIARGGPFYDLQLKAKLVHTTGLNPVVRAVAIAWGIPLILSLAAGTAFGPSARPWRLGTLLSGNRAAYFG